jgi:predicted metal-dependent hydrolase
MNGARQKVLGHMTQASRLKHRLDHWACRLRLAPRLVRVQRMTRKWGSCSDSGIISLAVDLADQDGGFQDFVIVHELLHLRVQNHGKLFTALLGAHIPEWRRIKERSVASACNRTL